MSTNGPTALLERLHALRSLGQTEVVVVTGTRRGLADAFPGAAPTLRDWVRACLDAAAPQYVILGDCPTGVDAYAREWCKANLPATAWWKHSAAWKLFGTSAGPRRNQVMVGHALQYVQSGSNVRVLAFPRGGPGTRDCMKQARRAGLTVEEL